MKILRILPPHRTSCIRCWKEKLQFSLIIFFLLLNLFSISSLPCRGKHCNSVNLLHCCHTSFLFIKPSFITFRCIFLAVGKFLCTDYQATSIPIPFQLIWRYCEYLGSSPCRGRHLFYYMYLIPFFFIHIYCFTMFHSLQSLRKRLQYTRFLKSSKLRANFIAWLWGKPVLLLRKLLLALLVFPVGLVQRNSPVQRRAAVQVELLAAWAGTLENNLCKHKLLEIKGKKEDQRWDKNWQNVLEPEPWTQNGETFTARWKRSQ